MQEEEYPIYKWTIQKQTSEIFGLFPRYVGTSLQWVFQDYEAFGFLSFAGTQYESELPNGFAFKEGDDFARIYHCKDTYYGIWGLWGMEETAYILEWAGAKGANRQAGLDAAIQAFNTNLPAVEDPDCKDPQEKKWGAY